MDSNLLSRFRAALAELVPADGIFPKIGLAISGGPDSLALLLMAKELCPGSIAAATVDHQLRPEAAEEARFVAGLCNSFGIPHNILVPSAPIRGNIQSKARTTRYALLRQWMAEQGCLWLATAHHADDQLETILMRLSRGSGVDGLSAIRRKNGDIIRPLLSFRKEELIHVCRQAGVVPVQDPSNENEDFDRVRIRKFLEKAPSDLDPVMAAKSAAALGEAAEALDWTAQYFAGERLVSEGGTVSVDPHDLPAEIQRRLVTRALLLLQPDMRFRRDGLSRLISSLHAGQTSTLGGILCRGGPIWKFSLAPPRQTGTG